MQWQLQEMINAVGEALFESKKGKLPKTQCCHKPQRPQEHLPNAAERMKDAISCLAQHYRHFKPGVRVPQIFTDGV
jgi:hypothetical protein